MHDPEQKQNIARVSAAISATVKSFCRDVLASLSPPTFYMTELTTAVSRAGMCAAPDSAGRILRDLRKRGELDYKLVSRSQSLYEVVSVK